MIGDKFCNSCETIKPMNKFYNSKANSDGKHSQCIKCFRESRKRSEVYMNEEQYKQFITKLAENFQNVNFTKDDLIFFCNSMATSLLSVTGKLKSYLNESEDAKDKLAKDLYIESCILRRVGP